jgi:UDP-N-acetylmuramyl tripeptide synthase
MLVAVVRAHGLKVFTNPSTANISQGFYSSIVEQSDLHGRITGDVAILEMDEGHAAEISQSISPTQVTILNVLDDQLDRFVDPELVRQKLQQVAQKATGALILNADDQNLLLINEEMKAHDSKHSLTTWFGISQDLIMKSKVGLGNSPTYLDELARPDTQTHITSQNGTVIEAKIGSKSVSFSLPNRGLHFALDSAAALESARRFLGTNFDPDLAAKTIGELPPVFARGEVTQVNGVEVEFILVQNPMSFQLNLDNLPEDVEQLMVAIGRDVHDPSWLWTVDMSALKRVDVVSGFNFAEIALRLAYEGVQIDKIVPELEEAIQIFFATPAPTNGRRVVVFSADAMRRTRRILGLVDPEQVSR